MWTDNIFTLLLGEWVVVWLMLNLEFRDNIALLLDSIKMKEKKKKKKKGMGDLQEEDMVGD